MQAPEQDGEVQHPEGVQVRSLQEGLLQVLICSPLSKTVKYNTLKVSKSARSKKAFSKF